MERIIQGYLNNFISEFEYSTEPSEIFTNFEKFCAYIILKNELPNSSFDENDINSLSLGENKGIDSICYIVNGKLINDIKQVDDLLELNGYLEILLIFLQSKTSEKFEDSEIGNFGDTIKDFFNDIPNFLKTNEAKNAHEILMYFYDHFVDVKKLHCLAYFCSTGKWNDKTTCNQTMINKNQEINKEHGDKFKNGKFYLEPK